MINYFVLEERMRKHEHANIRVPIESNNLCITRNDQACILCGACKSVCKFSQGVYGHYQLEKTKNQAICIGCGQCTLVCPTSAITEVEDYLHVKAAIMDPEKVVMIQTSPSVRAALGEAFGLEPGTFVEGKMVAALKALGADYVFDTTFGADLTIMEEATELVKRIQKKEALPMMTSCCPAWVNFIETFFPKLLPHLSTAKSPILMQGAVIKTYFALHAGIDPKRIVNVAVTPCTAKKGEIKRPEMNSSAKYHQIESMRDVDYVITTRELATWLREEHLDFASLEEAKYDDVLARGTGAGMIFGNSGGVMEAALRTAYHMLMGKTPPLELLQYEPVRGLDHVKKATVTIADTTLTVAVINGTFQARKFLMNLEESGEHYDFIEVMSCRGGCIAGGGTPKTEIPLPDEIKERRMQALYDADQQSRTRCSDDNPDIVTLYETFLGAPNSELAHTLLHTSYVSQADKLGEPIHS